MCALRPSLLPLCMQIVVVEAVRALCLKFPAKYRALMTFLSNVLREEGGFEYKKAIVSSILALIQEIPDAKEMGLSHLCEFIEDCEFTFLSTQILHLLGAEGPSTRDPARYIRCGPSASATLVLQDAVWIHGQHQQAKPLLKGLYAQCLP